MRQRGGLGWKGGKEEIVAEETGGGRMGGTWGGNGRDNKRGRWGRERRLGGKRSVVGGGRGEEQDKGGHESRAVWTGPQEKVCGQKGYGRSYQKFQNAGLRNHCLGKKTKGKRWGGRGEYKTTTIALSVRLTIKKEERYTENADVTAKGGEGLLNYGLVKRRIKSGKAVFKTKSEGKKG